LALAP